MPRAARDVHALPAPTTFVVTHLEGAVALKEGAPLAGNDEVELAADHTHDEPLPLSVDLPLPVGELDDSVIRILALAIPSDLQHVSASDPDDARTVRVDVYAALPAKGSQPIAIGRKGVFLRRGSFLLSQRNT